jgi:hypothetical protein
MGKNRSNRRAGQYQVDRRGEAWIALDAPALDNGRRFYHNPGTGDNQWDLPPGAVARPATAPEQAMFSLIQTTRNRIIDKKARENKQHEQEGEPAKKVAKISPPESVASDGHVVHDWVWRNYGITGPEGPGYYYSEFYGTVRFTLP